MFTSTTPKLSGGESITEAHISTITDVIMPHMGGVELAETIREAQPDLKVLFISGYAPIPIARQAAHSEEVDLLEKPFSLSTLLERVREILYAAKK